MDNNNLLKPLILEKYRSLYAFAKVTGIPRTTLTSMFEKNIDQITFGNLQKICQALDISIEQFVDLELSKPGHIVVICTKEEKELLDKYRAGRVDIQQVHYE